MAFDNRFTGHFDRFHGVSIDCAKQGFTSDAEFIAALKDAILDWKQKGKRGLWAKVNHASASLVPHLIQLGFDFHHAQPGYVMMTLWMSDDHPNHLPEYANHYIGVGGFVVNADNQLLVIREKYANSTSAWKLPGGHADNGEDLADTAHREVLEETGLECEFVSLLAFRHQHKYRFSCSDIYFICLMRPLGGNIKPCPMEIAECCWMDLDDFINDKEVSDANRQFAQCYKDGLKHTDVAIVPRQVLSFDKKKFNNVYSVSYSTESHQL